MSKICTKFYLTFLLILSILINIGLTDQTKSETDVEYEIKSFSGESENGNSFNATDDYDYSDEESGQINDEESLIEKIRLLHAEGKNLTISKRVQHINQTLDIFKNIVKNIETFLPMGQRTTFEFLEFLTQIDLGLSHQCLAAILKVMSSLRNRDLWALKFLDSMGFPTSGFVEGVQSSFGEYDECLNIKSPSSKDDTQPFKGQYCLLKVILPFPKNQNESLNQTIEFASEYANEMNLQKFVTVKSLIERLNLWNGTIYRFGICIPSVCSAHEIENMVNNILFPITRLPLEVGPKCDTKDKTIKLDNYQLISISILTALTTLVILSTGLEVYNNQKELEIAKNFPNPSTQINAMWLSFSIIRNTRSLFAKNTKFPALDTIRLLLIINVHIAHIYQFTTTIGMLTLKKIYSEVLPKVFSDNRYVFARSPLMIDAFIALSGFLLSYGLLKKLEKSKARFNYFNFLFQRWIKFSILVFGSILFFYLLPLFGDGPVWDIGINYILPSCRNPRVLLENFLFINNFSDTIFRASYQRCNSPTWFLSTLLQLMIIAPIFIITYFKKPILGLYAIITAIIISLFASISPQVLFGIKPYLQIWELETVLFSISKSFKWYHNTPNVYATSFFVGIAFGYLMKRKILFTRLQEILFWILSITMILTVYFWHNSFWRLDKSAPLWSALLWHSIGKLFFSSGFCWILYACCTGRGGILNRFLSWHGFQPVARLSFGIYLLHYTTVFYRIFTIREVYVMTDKLMFQNIVIDLMIDTLLAYILYILVESPLTNIFEVLLSEKGRPIKKPVENYNKESQMSKL